MEGDAPGGGRDPGGDVDDAPADRGGRCSGVRAAGDGPSGTGEVERDDGEDEPRGVRVEPAGGQVGEGGAQEASKTCSMMA